MQSDAASISERQRKSRCDPFYGLVHFVLVNCAADLSASSLGFSFAVSGECNRQHGVSGPAQNAKRPNDGRKQQRQKPLDRCIIRPDYRGSQHPQGFEKTATSAIISDKRNVSLSAYPLQETEIEPPQ